MTEEESIEIFKNWLEYNKKHKNILREADKIIAVQETILNLIQKLQEENKNYKRMLAEIHAQSLNSSISEKKKHEEQLEALNKGWKIELEKKEKMIDLMAFLIASKIGTRTVVCKNMNCDKTDIENCKMCAIQYFKNKAI